MNAIDIFPWDDNFCTGIAEIDEQHRVLVDLLNRLAAFVAYQADDLVLEQVFDELTAYALHHFASEEAIWHRHLPEDRAEISHREVHCNFVREVERMKGSLGARPLIELGEEVLGFLARWLAAHILESDRYLAYVVRARQAGQDVQAAKAWAKEQMGGATRVLIDIILSIYSTLSNNTLKLMRELAQHRLAREALEESQGLLRTVIDTAPIRVFWKDRDLRYLGANPAFVQDTGLSSADALVGRDDTELGWAAHASSYQRDDQAVIQSGQSRLAYEECQTTADGRTVWLSTSKAPLRDPQGDIIGVLGIYEDVTEHKKAVLEQQRLNRALRLLSECNLALARNEDLGDLFDDICSLIVDTGGYSLAWIRLAQEGRLVSGAPTARAARTPEVLATLVSLEGAPDAASAAALRTGQTELGALCLAAAGQGTAAVSAKTSLALPLIGQEGVLGVLTLLEGDGEAFTSDEITLMEELAANLSYGIGAIRIRSQREAALASNRAKDAFIANISHEVRTPLNAISGMLYMLRRSGVTPEQDERLRKIEAAGQHLLEIINTVLDMSKIEAGKLTLEEQDMDLNALMNSALALIQDKAAAKGITLSVKGSAEHLPLKGDATRMQQALLNYLSNAVKFTETGSIQLVCLVQEETPLDVLVRMEVRDTGIGIPADVLPRLFQDFEQADNSTTRHFGGTGLGLAITRRIAQLMQGDAGVDSREGQGSTFWFTARLRRCQPPPEVLTRSDRDSAETLLQRHFSGSRLLLVEDDPINQEIACCILEDTGLQVDLANDGLEAVELARQRRYDLILMDMQMPRMDGLQAARVIRMHPGYGEVPIVAMTANAYEGDRLHCMEAGMNAFVAKPVEHTVLFETLLACLGGARSLLA
ncbi:bacteriohemerythrin [Zoogloea sp.]|uniref:bacteriohemerythrin n=1 Tax=Zoogloea sp. TaxID=49181 RepID=UPI0026205CA8|nr:bacteriohemerythrin [Zoogloea sp.]MDD3355062.1 bacteriohemerythrin [Zoogloea sp.]